MLNLTGVQASGPATVSQLTAPAGPPPAPPAPGMGRFGGPPATVAHEHAAAGAGQDHRASGQHDRLCVRR